MCSPRSSCGWWVVQPSPTPLFDWCGERSAKRVAEIGVQKLPTKIPGGGRFFAPPLRPQRGKPGSSRRGVSVYDTPAEEQIAPLARVEGVRLISVQKGHGAEQVSRVARRFPVTELGDELDPEGGFLDTAAVMQNLDLVVTAETSVGHLAGALGVPVWLALSAVADWRWLVGRTDTPWYPTMRLFR